MDVYKHGAAPSPPIEKGLREIIPVVLFQLMKLGVEPQSGRSTKEMRKQFGLTQVDLAAKSGVGLRFVRELEQGKETLRLDKVNQVLLLFGQEIGPVPIRKE